MKLLIVGGTRFLGYHLVAAARARQHEVTLFHRGKHAVVLHPDVEMIHGDRDLDLRRLQGRRWDAVIDTCGYLPRSVRASAEALAAAVGQYVFISSLSVYADFSKPGNDETSPVAELTDGQLHEANAIDTSGLVSAQTFGRLYGALKARCEQTAAEVLPGRVLSVRAGLLVGPYEYTERFTYWAARVARGGEVLAPPQRFVQMIDVRDLSEWILQMIERRHSGVFNATGPPDTITMAALLETLRTVSGSDASFTWASERFLLAEGVTPWSELPLWLPEEAAPETRGFMAVRCEKALAAGLRCRSLDETMRDLWQWYAAEDQSRKLRAGLTADRERQLLQWWHAA